MTFWQMEGISGRILKSLQQDTCSHDGCYTTVTEFILYSGINLDFLLKLNCLNRGIFISYYFLLYSILDPTLTREKEYLTSGFFHQKFLVTLQQCMGGFVYYFIYFKNHLLGRFNCC